MIRFSKILALILVLSFYNAKAADEPTPTPTPIPPHESGKYIGSGKEKITFELTSPRGGWTVDRMLLVEGEISDKTLTPVTVIINGDRYLLRTTDGKFSRKFPVTAGKNTVVVQAVNQAGTFQEQRTVYAKIPTVPLMFVLTSDTDGVYTDLHIYEPSPDVTNFASKEAQTKVAHVYWAATDSPTGGKFYLNQQAGDFDSPGFGPYLYTHTSPPLGIYRIDSNYWPSGDKAHTLSTLNITVFGGTEHELKRMVRTPLVTPGETRTLAWVRIDKGQKAYIWSPVNEAKPAQKDVWPAWVLKYEPIKRSSDGYAGDGGDL